MTFGAEKNPAWFGYPIVKNYEDTITRFGRIHKRDRRTDGRTSHDGTGRACIASRGKNQSSQFVREICPHDVSLRT